MSVDDRLRPELLDDPPCARRVDEDPRFDRTVFAVRERVVAHEPGGVEARRWFERPWWTDLGVAVDAIDAERARRVAFEVVADDVPVPPTEHDAVRFQPPDL